jgi:hypothetical protein
VLTPDVVHGLARNRDPTARFARDLDHASRVRMSCARSSRSGAFLQGSFRNTDPRQGLSAERGSAAQPKTLREPCLPAFQERDFRQPMWTGTRLISESVLVGLIVFATAAGQTSTRVADHRPESVKCKLRSAHFLGTTRQGQKVCLTISPRGRRLVEYVFQARWKCSNGTRPLGSVLVRPPPLYEIIVGKIVGGGSLVQPRPSVRSDGSFVSTSAPPSRFSGQIRGSTANGILRWHVPSFIGGGLTCDTGRVRWTAGRIAH